MWVADLLQVSESAVVVAAAAAAAAVMAVAVVDDPAATTLHTAFVAIFAVVRLAVISELGAVVAAAVLEIGVSGWVLAEGAEPSQWFALSAHRWDAAPFDSMSVQDASNFGHSCHLLS